MGEVVATYRDRLAPGSFLAISQASHENVTPDVSAEIDRVIATYRSVNEQLTLRSKAEIEGWFAETELVEPGLVPYPDWRFDDERLTETELACRFGYVGVGRKQ